MKTSLVIKEVIVINVLLYWNIFSIYWIKFTPFNAFKFIYEIDTCI